MLPAALSRVFDRTERAYANSPNPNHQGHANHQDHADPATGLRLSVRLLRLRELRILRRIHELLLAEARAGLPTGELDADGNPQFYPSLIVKGDSRTDITKVSDTGRGSGESSTVGVASESFAEALARWEKLLTAVQELLRRHFESLARLNAAAADAAADAARAGSGASTCGVLLTPGLLEEDEWEQQANL